MAWTKAAIEARVWKLAEEHEGRDLVAAVVEFGGQLDDRERDVLGGVLVEQAGRRGGLQHALMEETRRPRWFRRVMERGRRTAQ